MIVRRRVRRGAEQAFEAAMREFIGFALAFPGNQGINVLRPDAGTSSVYTVVDRFADPAARHAFKMTPEYAAWMKRLGELTDGDPQIQEIGGLGGWFTPPGLSRETGSRSPQDGLRDILGRLPAHQRASAVV